MLVAGAKGLASSERTQGDLERAIDNWNRLWNAADPLGRNTVSALALVALLAIAVITLKHHDPSRAGLRILAWWQLLMSIAMLTAMLYTGAYIDRWTLRYLLGPLYFGVIFLTSIAAFRLGAPDCKGIPNRWPNRIAVGLALALLIGLAMNLSSMRTATYEAPQRRVAACLARASAREQARIVVSDYWHAKPLMLLTNDVVHVVQVARDLQPSFWINNRAWYVAPGEYGIVVRNGLDPLRITKLIGRPQLVEFCEGLELYIYRDVGRAYMSRRLRAIAASELAKTADPAAPPPLQLKDLVLAPH
jgi:hypothetical protein